MINVSGHGFVLFRECHHSPYGMIRVDVIDVCAVCCACLSGVGAIGCVWVSVGGR